MHKIRSFHGTFVDAGGGDELKCKIMKLVDFSTGNVISRGLPLEICLVFMSCDLTARSIDIRIY